MTELTGYQTDISVDAALIMGVENVLREVVQFPRSRSVLEKMVNADSKIGFVHVMRQSTLDPSMRSFFVELSGSISTLVFAKLALNEYPELRIAYIYSGVLELAKELYTGETIPMGAFGNSFNNVKDGNFEKIEWLAQNVSTSITPMAKQYILSSGILVGKSLKEINDICPIEDEYVKGAFSMSIKYQHKEIFDLSYDVSQINSNMLLASCLYKNNYFFNKLSKDANDIALKTAFSDASLHLSNDHMKAIMKIYKPDSYCLYFIHAIESGDVEKLKELQKVEKQEYPLSDVLDLFIEENGEEKYEQMIAYIRS